VKDLLPRRNGGWKRRIVKAARSLFRLETFELVAESDRPNPNATQFEFKGA